MVKMTEHPCQCKACDLCGRPCPYQMDEEDLICSRCRSDRDTPGHCHADYNMQGMAERMYKLMNPTKDES
jgi:hypothetical protein